MFVCVVCRGIRSYIHSFTNSFTQSPSVYLISTHMLGAAESVVSKGSWPSEAIQLLVHGRLAPLPTRRFSTAPNLPFLPPVPVLFCPCSYEVPKTDLYLIQKKEKVGQWSCKYNSILSSSGNDIISSVFFSPSISHMTSKICILEMKFIL